jgi:hypothetical protein
MAIPSVPDRTGIATAHQYLLHLDATISGFVD